MRTDAGGCVLPWFASATVPALRHTRILPMFDTRVATIADLAGLRVELAGLEARLVKWMIGIVFAGAGLVIGALSAVARIVVRGTAPVAVSAAHLPPSGATARGDLAMSPRRAEFVDVRLPGSAAPIRNWVVYPERSRAPVVMVVHDLYGLSDWVRSVADAFAAEGFIAVAPDLLSGVTRAGSDHPFFVGETRVIPTVAASGPRERTNRLDAVRSWVLDLPAANGRLGMVGFSWGGSAGFAYAVEQPELVASASTVLAQAGSDRLRP